MHKDLLAQSPLLILPLIALFVFLGVFVVAVVRAMSRSRSDVDECAKLPFSQESVTSARTSEDSYHGR